MALSFCAYLSTFGLQYHGSLNVPGTADSQLRIGSKKSLGSGKSWNQAVHVIGTFFLVPTAAISALPFTTLRCAVMPMPASCWTIACEIRESSPTLSVQKV